VAEGDGRGRVHPAAGNKKPWGKLRKMLKGFPRKGEVLVNAQQELSFESPTCVKEKALGKENRKKGGGKKEPGGGRGAPAWQTHLKKHLLGGGDINQQHQEERENTPRERERALLRKSRRGLTKKKRMVWKTRNLGSKAKERRPGVARQKGIQKKLARTH